MNNEKRITELERKLELMELKLNEALRKLDMKPLTSPFPVYPVVPLERPNECPKCGIQLKGAMGYVCGDSQCPVGLGGITC